MGDVGGSAVDPQVRLLHLADGPALAQGAQRHRTLLPQGTRQVHHRGGHLQGFEKDALLGQPRPERAERIPPGQRRDARAAGPRFGQQEPMGGRLFSGQDGRGTLATAVNPPAMNNTRRKSLRELIEKTEGIKQEIEEIKTEEEEYYNNMPSSVQDGEKGDRAQTVIEYLDEAMTAAGDVIENLTSAAE